MEPTSLPPGRSFEEEVANFFRECGAMKVSVDVELAGNQIDVYVEEPGISGNRIRTIVECKDYAEAVGVHKINDFAQVFTRIKLAGLADKAVFVAARAFSRPAKAAAAEAHIDLLTADDIRSKLKRIQSIQLISVASQDLILAVQRQGRILGFRSDPLSINNYSETETVYDPNLIQRVKIIAEYIKELERLGTDPTGRIVAIDTTGTATAFSNWITNPLYMALLQAGANFTVAYQQLHGESSVGVQRNFVIDTDDINPQFINNLEKTLKIHLHFGIAIGIIFKNSNVPNDVLADIANLAERVCIDYGRIEGLGTTPPRLLDVMAPAGDHQFRRIRERVAWASDKKNLHAFAQYEDDVQDVLAEVKSKMKKDK